MNAIYPALLFVITATVWLITAKQNSRLVELFWKKHPETAKQELSDTSERNPKNTLYFFRRRSLTILRGDHEIWRQRQRLKFLMLLSALVPLVGFLILALVAFTLSKGLPQ